MDVNSTLATARMLLLVIVALFLVVPVFVHHRTFDVANGSAASALILGVGCGLLGLTRQGWAIGLVSFFLASFVGFAVAYFVGLVYLSLGSNERKAFAAAKAAAPVSGGRQVVGAVGAVSIALAFFGTLALAWWQSGAWPAVPSKAALGFLAFFFLGMAVLIRQYVARRKG